MAVLVGIFAFFVIAALFMAVVSFAGFLLELLTLPFSLVGLIVSVVQQKRGMGENGRTLAMRALIVGAIGAVALAAIAFFMGASIGYIGIAALVGLFLGAMFGL
jgi:hypothetical protein